jgi:hypothetical protein
MDREHKEQPQEQRREELFVAWIKQDPMYGWISLARRTENGAWFVNGGMIFFFVTGEDVVVPP